MSDCGLQEFERFENTNFFKLDPLTNDVNELPLIDISK
jgi:hypothetical protein